MKVVGGPDAVLDYDGWCTVMAAPDGDAAAVAAARYLLVEAAPSGWLTPAELGEQSDRVLADRAEHGRRSWR